MDFLTEFKKDFNVTEPSDNNNDDNNFEFVEEEQNPKQNEKKEINPIQKIFSINFNTEKEKQKFNHNLKLIFDNLNKELEKNIPFLNKLWSFANVEITKSKISNSKPLINFLNGNIQLLVNYAKFIATKNLINIKNVNINQKLFQKIYEFMIKFQKSSNYGNLINKELLESIKNQKIDIDKIIDKGGCRLCLHSLDNEKYENVYGYDFHITCINVWVNLVDLNSPFK